MSDFSSNLRRARKQCQLSQDALAEKLNVTRQTVSSWERGNSYPDLDTLVALSDALSVSPNDLLYPAERKGARIDEEILTPHFFRVLAGFVFLIGALLGLFWGNDIYSPAPNVVDHYFNVLRALPYWTISALIGIAFLGLSKVIALLQELKNRE